MHKFITYFSHPVSSRLPHKSLSEEILVMNRKPDVIYHAILKLSQQILGNYVMTALQKAPTFLVLKWNKWYAVTLFTIFQESFISECTKGMWLAFVSIQIEQVPLYNVVRMSG